MEWSFLHHNGRGDIECRAVMIPAFLQINKTKGRWSQDRKLIKMLKKGLERLNEKPIVMLKVCDPVSQ